MNYETIISLSHYELRHHVRMSLAARAAQFAPFAALTGYSEFISEEGRLTQEKKILSEDEKKVLDELLQEVLRCKDVKVRILYFEKDLWKKGGKYLSYEGIIWKVDLFHRLLYFNKTKKISLDDISSIQKIN